MTTKLTTIFPARSRHQISFKDSVSKTRQEFTRESNINNIVKQGIIQNTHPLNYADLVNLPSFEDAFNTVRHAHDSFMQLPSVVRKMIDNDPSKLQDFISDPENTDLLLKTGVLKAKKPATSAPKEPMKGEPTATPPEAPEAPVDPKK